MQSYHHDEMRERWFLQSAEYQAFSVRGGGLHKEVMKYAIPRMANNSAPTLLSSYGAGGVTVENLFKTSFRHKGAVLIIQRNETGNQ